MAHKPVNIKFEMNTTSLIEAMEKFNHSISSGMDIGRLIMDEGGDSVDASVAIMKSRRAPKPVYASDQSTLAWLIAQLSHEDLKRIGVLPDDGDATDVTKIIDQAKKKAQVFVEADERLRLKKKKNKYSESRDLLRDVSPHDMNKIFDLRSKGYSMREVTLSLITDQYKMGVISYQEYLERMEELQ